MRSKLLPHIAKGLHNVLLDSALADLQFHSHFTIFLAFDITKLQYLPCSRSQLVETSHNCLYLILAHVPIVGIMYRLFGSLNTCLHIMTPHILLAYVVQTDIPDRHHQISRNIFNLLLLCSSPNQFESIGYDILACFVIVQDAQRKKICLGVLLLKESFKTSFIHLSFLHTFHYALKRRRNRTVWSRQRYTFL